MRKNPRRRGEKVTPRERGTKGVGKGLAAEKKIAFGETKIVIEGARAGRIKGGDGEGEELNHIKSLKFAPIRRDAL